MREPAETQGRDSLEEIAMLALEFGRLLMEAGASARSVEEITARVAVGLGAERMDLRVGYASLAITIGHRARRHHPDAQSRPVGREPERYSSSSTGLQVSSGLKSSIFAKMLSVSGPRSFW